jgi:hypothetical protein
VTAFGERGGAPDLRDAGDANARGISGHLRGDSFSPPLPSCLFAHAIPAACRAHHCHACCSAAERRCCGCVRLSTAAHAFSLSLTHCAALGPAVPFTLRDHRRTWTHYGRRANSASNDFQRLLGVAPERPLSAAATFFPISCTALAPDALTRFNTRTEGPGVHRRAHPSTTLLAAHPGTGRNAYLFPAGPF